MISSEHSTSHRSVCSFFFFFSSRRRHTRCHGDWSSDVCSSDLGDPTSLAPHERLTDLAVVPREKPHTGAAAREQPRDSPAIERGGPSSPAWPSDQSRDLSPNASGGLTPLSPPSELPEIPVATREQSGLLCFPSR